MDERRYHYADVPEILAGLQAEGRSLSIANVRERRGAGSNSYISEDLKRWKYEQGLEVSGEDQEDIPPLPLHAMPYSLPEPDSEMVERYRAESRLQVDLVAYRSHLRASIAAMRCAQALAPKVTPGLTQRHLRSQDGLAFLDRTRPPWRDASDEAEDLEPRLLQVYETLLQMVAMTPQEDRDGNGRPAA